MVREIRTGTAQKASSGGQLVYYLGKLTVYLMHQETGVQQSMHQLLLGGQASFNLACLETIMDYHKKHCGLKTGTALMHWPLGVLVQCASGAISRLVVMHSEAMTSVRFLWRASPSLSMHDSKPAAVFTVHP